MRSASSTSLLRRRSRSLSSRCGTRRARRRGQSQAQGYREGGADRLHAAPDRGAAPQSRTGLAAAAGRGLRAGARNRAACQVPAGSDRAGPEGRVRRRCPSPGGGTGGQVCGTILWETKRTKNWSDGWLGKLREDQRTARAEIALLVSNALPKGVETFDQVDGVWVTEPRCMVPVALALRQTLIELAGARQASRASRPKWSSSTSI